MMRWSRDWSRFNLSAEVDRVLSGMPSTLSALDFEEYLLWIKLYHPDVFWGYILMELEDMELQLGKAKESTDELIWYINDIKVEKRRK